MAKKSAPLLPANELRLQQFGDRLRLARLRRRLTAKQVAERAGMTPVTLRNLERGNSGVTIGAYLAVMQILGIEQDLDAVAKDDPLGRRLQDTALPRRSRKSAKRSKQKISAEDEASVPASPHSNSAPTVQTPDSWAIDSGFVTTEALAALIKPPKPVGPRRLR